MHQQNTLLFEKFYLQSYSAAVVQDQALTDLMIAFYMRFFLTFDQSSAANFQTILKNSNFIVQKRHVPQVLQDILPKMADKTCFVEDLQKKTQRIQIFQVFQRELNFKGGDSLNNSPRHGSQVLLPPPSLPVNAVAAADRENLLKQIETINVTGKRPQTASAGRNARFSPLHGGSLPLNSNDSVYSSKYFDQQQQQQQQALQNSDGVASPLQRPQTAHINSTHLQFYGQTREDMINYFSITTNLKGNTLSPLASQQILVMRQGSTAYRPRSGKNRPPAQNENAHAYVMPPTQVFAGSTLPEFERAASANANRKPASASVTQSHSKMLHSGGFQQWQMQLQQNQAPARPQTANSNKKFQKHVKPPVQHMAVLGSHFKDMTPPKHAPQGAFFDNYE